MADCEGQLFQDESLQRLKQRILPELTKVTNHFQILGTLMARGVLSDGSSDSEDTFLMKQMMIHHAIMIACYGGADAVSGLKEAMEESGNSGLFSALLTWAEAEEELALGLGDLSELQGHNSALDTPSVQQLEKRAKIPYELSSSGTKFIDKIMSSEEKDIMEQLESYLVENASKVANAQDFCSSLVPQDVWRERDNNLVRTKKAIRAACSTRAIGSLVIALQRTDNENILEETCQWLEALQARNKNYPISVPSLSNHQIEPKSGRSAFFEQPAPLDDLKKVAVLNCQPDSSTKGTFSMEFNKDRMLVYLTDGTVHLQNWRDNEEKTVEFGAKVKNITCFQYDEEICVLGTENGIVYLFDSKALEVKWFVRLGDLVKSLKFVESKLVVVTTALDYDRFWCVDISRADMKLLNKRLVSRRERGNSMNSGVFINPDYSFLHCAKFVMVLHTESGQQVRNKRGAISFLRAPAEINTLNVVDLISTKNVVVAGCINGVIAIWDDYLSCTRESPAKTLEGHMDAIVSLCSLNGHLLSVEKSGQLLMWSGYDLENTDNTPPVPQLLSANFYNVNCLVAHDRWFAASSFEGNSVSVWTLPDLWLRTG